MRLIEISRANPDLLSAAITHFFFFRDKEKLYGPPVQPLAFQEFFDYKWLINLDGTVAAYRLPFLLAGGSTVFKQDSPFYEVYRVVHGSAFDLSVLDTIWKMLNIFPF